MAKVGNIYVAKDRDIIQAEQDFKSFRQEKLNQLTETERMAIQKQANIIIDEVKARCPSVIFSKDMLLEAVISAQYYMKFGETPTQTRIDALMKGR